MVVMSSLLSVLNLLETIRNVVASYVFAVDMEKFLHVRHDLTSRNSFYGYSGFKIGSLNSKGCFIHFYSD